MKLVEKHTISENHSFYKEIDNLSFLSKNLYNQANYRVRQSFINEREYLNYNIIEKQLQNQTDYKALPAKVSQQILIQLDKNWKSFLASIKDYSDHPEKYSGRPKIPKYKKKLTGRNILIYTIQAISKKELKNGIVKLSGTNIKIKTDKNNIQQVRIIPGNREYIIEIVYEKEEINLNLNIDNFISIDIGLDNLATITSNKGMPLIVNGRLLKSINQYFNKEKSRLQSFIGDKGTSRKIVRLANKRNKKVSDYLHNASRYIINHCIQNDIGKIIIGKNKQWKSGIEIGKVNNQNFVSIPHAEFIQMIEYKAKLIGIEVLLTEESYTSKCSFIDDEKICKHENYLGIRIKRGLFRTFNNIAINADVNARFNIARKVIPRFNVKELDEGIEGFVVNPVRINPYKLKSS